jgi:hypothetical protein
MCAPRVSSRSRTREMGGAWRVFLGRAEGRSCESLLSLRHGRFLINSKGSKSSKSSSYSASELSDASS